jgi:hypothetical protein
VVDEARFWAFIADCRVEAPEGGERLAEVLRARLRSLSPDEILSFDDHWGEAYHRLYTWPVWDAACVLLGWVGDDSFGDVRAWIISHGREATERVIADPDSLADLAGDHHNAFVEDFHSLAAEAYEDVAGAPPLVDTSVARAGGPIGERIDLKDPAAVTRRFPRLAAIGPIDGDGEHEPLPVEFDESERCPTCSAALPANGVQSSQQVEPGTWVTDEYRRCMSCPTIAFRTGGGNWQAITEADVPEDTAMLLFLDL